MVITNTHSGTNIDEIAAGIYRINTPVVMEGGPGGFSFNQYLIVDEEPLLFHTGPRKMFALIREAVSSVMPPERLRYVAFSHVEADECGSLNEWLAVAPQSSPLCGSVAAIVSMNDLADRQPRALADGETLSLGKHLVRWFDAPHLPHAWECGYLNVAIYWKRKREHCYAAICLLKAALIIQPSRSRTYSARAKSSAIRWTTIRTRKTVARCWKDSLHSNPKPLRVCTEAHGEETEQRCCEPSPSDYPCSPTP